METVETKGRRARAAWVVSIALVASLLAAYLSTAASGADEAAPWRVQERTSGAPLAKIRMPIAPGHERPLVVLYGDSLAWEAKEFFEETLAPTGAKVVTRTWGGTAICDFLPSMRSDAEQLRPDAVVVEFSGNALTPCMLDADGAPLRGADRLDAYRSDAETVLNIFPAARVYFAGAPMGRDSDERADFHGGSTNDLYRDLAGQRPGVLYVDAGAAVLDDGEWTMTLPCLPSEPCIGGFDAEGRAVNIVRDPVGNHFCPTSADIVDGVTRTCSVWSSGASRYGAAMAAAVAADIGQAAGDDG